MYLRTTTRRASDGSVVRYVQLAHNRRVNGVTQAHVLANLGREEHLDVEGLRRLVGSIQRRIGDDGRQDPGPTGPAASLHVLDVRPMGSVWLLDGLWKAIGVDAALRDGVAPRRWTPDVERVAFAAVAVRAVEPSAVGVVEQWVSRCVAVPGLETVTAGEVPAVTDLVATADLDIRLPGGPGGPALEARPRMLEAPRSWGDRRRCGESVLAWLAAGLVRLVEVRTGTPWSVVRGDLDRIAAVTVAGSFGTLVTVTTASASQADLYAACGVGAPPRVLAAAVA